MHSHRRDGRPCAASRGRLRGRVVCCVTPMYHRIVNAEHRGQLMELCNTLHLNGTAAEVGVYRGGFARHNLRTWKGATYYMIDAWSHRQNDTSGDKNSKSRQWHDSNYDAARNAVQPWLNEGARPRAIMLREFSEAAAQRFADSTFDFLYLDTGHDYHAIRRDLRMWWPKLRKGGMLAGDDFADFVDSYPSGASDAWLHISFKWGVKTAVAHFAREVGSPFFLTFADRSHQATENLKEIDEEFEVADRPLSSYRGGVENYKLLPSDHVRSHRFYPAWYLFK